MSAYNRLLPLGLILYLLGGPALAMPQHCGNATSPREIYIGADPGFDHYRHVLIDPISITSHQARWLDRHQRSRLSSVFRDAVALEWRERFGWRSTREPGADVVRLHVQINDVQRQDGIDSLTMDVSLVDSLSGRELMAQCNKTLTLRPPHLTVAGSGLPWQSVQQTVMHWGADLGSHIMTIN